MVCEAFAGTEFGKCRQGPPDIVVRITSLSPSRDQSHGCSLRLLQFEGNGQMVVGSDGSAPVTEG